MTSIIFFFIFVPILSIILLSVNFIFAPHKPYKEKKTPFECGYHSFLSQNRTQFTISFFIFALLFLIFDLEIVLIYPYSVSSYANNIYGLIVMIIFTLLLTVGFIFELGKNALKIESKQNLAYSDKLNSVKGNLILSTLKPKYSSFILPVLKFNKTYFSSFIDGLTDAICNIYIFILSNKNFTFSFIFLLLLFSNNFYFSHLAYTLFLLCTSFVYLIEFFVLFTIYIFNIHN